MKKFVSRKYPEKLEDKVKKDKLWPGFVEYVLIIIYFCAVK